MGKKWREMGNGVRSFILVSCLPSHQIADCRVMQMEVSIYLLLSITIFLDGINDLRICEHHPKPMLSGECGPLRALPGR